MQHTVLFHHDCESRGGPVSREAITAGVGRRDSRLDALAGALAGLDSAIQSLEQLRVNLCGRLPAPPGIEAVAAGETVAAQPCLANVLGQLPMVIATMSKRIEQATIGLHDGLV